MRLKGIYFHLMQTFGVIFKAPRWVDTLR